MGTGRVGWLSVHDQALGEGAFRGVQDDEVGAGGEVVERDGGVGAVERE